MTNILDATEKFMRAAGQLDEGEIGFYKDWEDRVRLLRNSLLKEEVKEWHDGEVDNDPVEVADGLLDIIVVAWGSLLAYFGPELAKKMAQSVADSNLSKVLPDGTVLKREDGKVMKPYTYVKPRIAEILDGVEFYVTRIEEH